MTWMMPLSASMSVIVTLTVPLRMTMPLTNREGDVGTLKGGGFGERDHGGGVHAA